MRVKPVRPRGARLVLGGQEGELIARAFAELRQVIAGLDVIPDDPVYRRLFPDGYSRDPDAVAQFRELTEQSLRDERIERIDECIGELAVAIPQDPPGGSITLDAGGIDRWIRVVNDIRLAVGTQLGVTEDWVPEDLGAEDPITRGYAVYAFFTAVQDDLVHCLMR